jgi:hypothetical protein
MTARALSVGAVYDPRVTAWPQGAAFVFYSGAYELLLRWHRPSPAEADAVARGPGALAFLVHKSALLILHRLGAGGTAEWADVPAAPHLWAELPGEGQQTCRIVLIDLRGIVWAARLVWLPAGFSQALRPAVLAARHAFTSEAALAHDVEEAEQLHTAAEMSTMGTHVTEHGPKRPGARA